MDKKEIGVLGEDFTARYYEKLGYEIKEKNYHSRYGEIDVIAENEEYIVFVEVKTRKAGSMVSPSQAVSRSKQKKIILTAMQYIGENDCFKQSRFDVFEIWQNEGRIFKFNHIEDAFDTGEFPAGYEIF